MVKVGGNEQIRGLQKIQEGWMAVVTTAGKNIVDGKQNKRKIVERRNQRRL